MDPRRGGQAAAALHLTHQQYNADIPARTAVRTQLFSSEYGGSTTESLATHQVTSPPSPPAERAVHVVCDTPASQIHPSTIKDGSTPHHTTTLITTPHGTRILYPTATVLS